MHDKSILVATYEGKHKHGFACRDLLKLSSSTPEASIVDNDLPMENMSNDMNVEH